MPLHLERCFVNHGLRKGDFPQSEKAAQETIALPIYTELSDEQAQYVVDQIVGLPKAPYVLRSACDMLLFLSIFSSHCGM